MNFNNPHNAPMWRRRLHDEIGLFDPGYTSAGDWEFWLRCARAGKTFYKINDPNVLYFANPDGASTRPGGRGALEGGMVLRAHARGLISEHLVSEPERFLGEVAQRLGATVDANKIDRRDPHWRYTAVQQALLQLRITSGAAAKMPSVLPPRGHEGSAP